MKIIENYYFVKRRIQFVLKFPQNPWTSAINNHPRAKIVEDQWIKEQEEEKKREGKKSKEKRRKRGKKKHLINDLSIKEDPSQNGKGRGGAGKRKGGHGARGWDYVIKAVTVHRTVIQNRAQLVCTRRVTPVPGSCTCVIVVIPALSIRVPRSPEITRIRKHTTCGRARTRSACARAANEPPLIYKLPINRLWVADEIGYQLIYILLSLSLSLSLSVYLRAPDSSTLFETSNRCCVPPVSIEGQDSQVAPCI